MVLFKEFFYFSYNVVMEKEMEAHSNILSWEISWTEEPGGLQSMRGTKWSDMT